ncbi:hypothetical protein BJ138DRAFT_1117754 [Hygrophoropsis aurantiaca]|uniref:Uncharacterized protein n=1 Tax=Hygrophoropsis aurantiaca TaxID=72124 RepID=A0ACB7ZYV4_9AGAM|nr:hypothetical protein BJ138DRAFT_1117754 [Hygrophoropsis aurantiaca]
MSVSDDNNPDFGDQTSNTANLVPPPNDAAPAGSTHENVDSHLVPSPDDALNDSAHENVNPQAYVEKFMKNWAKGQRLEFLNSHLPGYTTAVTSMRKAIRAWLEYRIPKNKKIGRRANAENDPWARFLKQLARLEQHKPRALQAHQRWSKDHFDTDVKTDFDK